jgi:glycosyltransferase involved in cell wall biosynthesis
VKVLLASPGWPPDRFANGIVTYVDAMRAGLESLGVEVRVVTGRIEGPATDEGLVLLSDPRSIPLIPQKRLKRLSMRALGDDFSSIDSARRMVRTIRGLEPSFQPDILEMEESFGVPRRISKKIDLPIVVRLHGPWFLNGDALGVPKDRTYQRRVELEGLAIKEAIAITSPSEDLLDKVRRFYGFALPNAEVIPNPAPEVEEADRWKLSDCDPNLIVYVGRFDRHKGGDLVIDAFASLADERKELRLAFIGPDRGLNVSGSGSLSLQDYVSTRVHDESVRARIEHLGRLSPDEVTKCRRRARAVVVASRFEVFGMVLVEALAQGCPVVGSDVGGISEILEHEENGLLFESSNAADLAEKMQTLLDDDDFSTKLGEQGRLDMEGRFSRHVVAKQTKALYERALAG